MSPAPLGVEFVARQAARHHGCTQIEMREIRSVNRGWYVFMHGMYQGEQRNFRADVIPTSATTFYVTDFHFIWPDSYG